MRPEAIKLENFSKEKPTVYLSGIELVEGDPIIPHFGELIDLALFSPSEVVKFRWVGAKEEWVVAPDILGGK